MSEIFTNEINYKQSLERILIINQQEIKLIITCQKGICVKCLNNKEIRLLSERKIWVGTVQTYQDKKYCWSCALNALYQLEQSDYYFANKKQIISELRTELNNYSNYQKNKKKLWSDHYVSKKPYCVNCQKQGIKEDEYTFCSDSDEDCLVKNWIKYHGSDFQKN